MDFSKKGAASVVTVFAVLFFIVTVLLTFALVQKDNQAKEYQSELFDMRQAYIKAGLKLPQGQTSSVLPPAQTDTKKKTAFSNRQFGFDYLKSWSVNDTLQTDTVVVASHPKLVDSAYVPFDQARLEITRVRLPWLHQPEEYLQETPYSVSHQTLTANSHTVLETINERNGQRWIQSVVMGDPQTDQAVITVKPADSAAALAAYKVVLDSLTLPTNEKVSLK